MPVNLAYKIEKTIDKIKSHRLSVAVWYVLRFILNMILPLYYKIMPSKEGESTLNYTDKEVIISLTSFPARIKKLNLVLESLFRQSVQPSRIILWLAEDQFPDSDKEELKERLKKYIRMGLGIKFCDDLRSHKKYYYTMKEYPDALVVTVDDDILFSTSMLKMLLATFKEYPDCVVTMRAHKMTFEDGKLLPYSQWITRAVDCPMGPDLFLCATGGAGALYPPGSLSEKAFEKDVFQRICFYADDIWLKCMEYMNGTKTVLTGKDNPEIISLMGEGKAGLAQINVEQNFNDKQLEEVTNYYEIKWSNK